MALRLLILAALCGLMQAARSFAPADHGAAQAGTGALAFGFVLLAAFFLGQVFKSLRLPRLTGYIATGILVGPSLLGLLTPSMVSELKLFNGVAISLIALTAGGELDFRAIRPLLRTVGWITVIAVLGTTLLIALVVFLLRGALPFMASLPLLPAVAVAAVLGVTMVAQSPAIVVALRDEMESEGPVTRTVLGVVVLADLVVIVFFALTSAFAQSVLGGHANALRVMRDLGWELFGSLGVGVVVGGLVAVYLRQVRGSAALFILVVCFGVAEIGSRVHLDPLLVALAAGMLVRNATGLGDRLVREIEGAALPVYVVFFAVAGAAIRLEALALVWLPALVIIGVRAFGLVAGTRLAARISGASPEVGRYAGFGLLPQAGLALALALLFARTFPTFGDGAAALTLGVVALNEIFAPVFFRVALVRSGEAGQRGARELSLGERESSPGVVPSP
jgi:Kef-type K+ transport system membrane component KefB